MEFKDDIRYYPHIFTMKHIPAWAKQKCNDAPYRRSA